MKFVEIKEIPGDRRYTARSELRDRLEEFVKMNIPIAKVENHGYATNRRAYNAFYKSNRRYAFPVDVIFRNEEVYLRRRDI